MGTLYLVEIIAIGVVPYLLYSERVMHNVGAVVRLWSLRGSERNINRRGVVVSWKRLTRCFVGQLSVLCVSWLRIERCMGFHYVVRIVSLSGSLQQRRQEF